MSRTVKLNVDKKNRNLYAKVRPEWHFDRSPRYGNRRKQVAVLKVLSRRKDRKALNAETFNQEYLDIL